MIPRTLFDSDMELFRDTVRKFLSNEATPRHESWEAQKFVDRDFWLQAGEQGMLCPQLPEQYGGFGVDFRYNCIVDEEIGRAGLSGLTGFLMHSNIVCEYILHYGNEQQKQKYLPQMVSGEAIGALAMSEPGAGSDVKSIKTTAVDQGDHYLVNGSKTFITNGYCSDIIVVAVKTDPTEGKRGVSLIIVEAGMAGFEKGQKLNKAGSHACDTAELFFQDVKVPKENLLGEEGKGFYYLMNDLAQERLAVAVSGQAVAESILEQTIEYVQERKAFGKEVASFQNTRFKIAEMDTELSVARVYLDRCIELHLQKQLCGTEAAKLKLHITDLQCKVLDECVQLHGGYGYMWEYPVTRAWADSRAQRIYAGSNEIMKEIISREIFSR
ncbi:acyl-CoA dehydrogenase family protein [Thalassotalea psychrophila]|uniref:Acyl-CoA dehydrogenase family protein n=1 Tax=Thalassotalea psychrophila TaxID=3065647 RepID=A0ABY9TZ93_9GAMM|nr:acyl-CoA dehydrogenase family protein [Colwelliaceae bacterium SQ149]